MHNFRHFAWLAEAAPYASSCESKPDAGLEQPVKLAHEQPECRAIADGQLVFSVTGFRLGAATGTATPVTIYTYEIPSLCRAVAPVFANL